MRDELDRCLCGGPLGPVVVLVVVVGEVVVVDVVGVVVVVVVVVVEVEVDPGVVVEVEVGDVVVVVDVVLVDLQAVGSSCLIAVTGSASGGLAWAATSAGVKGSEVGTETVWVDPSVK